MPVGLDKECRGECGAFGIGIHRPHFTPIEDFRDRVDRYIVQVRESERVPGVEEILLPGERGSREQERRLAEGIPIADRVWERTTALMDDIGVDWRRATALA